MGFETSEEKVTREFNASNTLPSDLRTWDSFNCDEASSSPSHQFRQIEPRMSQILIELSQVPLTVLDNSST